MENYTFYRICYKTLAGRTVETDILFKRLPDALMYVNHKNNPEYNWGAQYFVKDEHIFAYSTYAEVAERERSGRCL